MESINATEYYTIIDLIALHGYDTNISDFGCSHDNYAIMRVNLRNNSINIIVISMSPVDDVRVSVSSGDVSAISPHQRGRLAAGMPLTATADVGRDRVSDLLPSGRLRRMQAVHATQVCNRRRCGRGIDTPCEQTTTDFASLPVQVNACSLYTTCRLHYSTI